MVIALLGDNGNQWPVLGENSPQLGLQISQLRLRLLSVTFPSKPVMNSLWGFGLATPE